MKGKVCYFSNQKGYGFISTPGKADLFVHFSKLEMDGYKSLKEGQIVDFNIGIGPKGKPQAENVQVIEDDED